MPRFLVEVPHDESTTACIQAIDVFLRTGSHYLTHADWGCQDGVHKAWMVIDVESRHEARNAVPADYREKAIVVQLNHFSTEMLEKLHKKHGTRPA
jgi:hypothetical protein